MALEALSQERHLRCWTPGLQKWRRRLKNSTERPSWLETRSRLAMPQNRPADDRREGLVASLPPAARALSCRRSSEQTPSCIHDAEVPRSPSKLSQIPSRFAQNRLYLRLLARFPGVRCRPPQSLFSVQLCPFPLWMRVSSFPSASGYPPQARRQ